MADIIVNPDLLKEIFNDGALLLNKKTREVIEISSDEHWLLSQIEKKSTKEEIKRDFQQKTMIPKKEIDNYLNGVYNDFFEKKIILDRGESMKIKHIQNPAVNLREEDEDGALLFNPDSNRIQLLNNTGFFIWKQCSEGKTCTELAEAIIKEYSDVSNAQANEDVKKFLDEMVEIGFIEIKTKSKSKKT